MSTDRLKASSAAVSAKRSLCSLPAFTTRAQAGSAALTASSSTGSEGGGMQSIEWARKVICNSCELVAYLPPNDEVESIGWCSIRRHGKSFRDICAACWRIEQELRKVR